MSGPKCAHWSVAENLRLDEIAREQAWAEVERLTKLVATEAAKVEALRRNAQMGVTVAAGPSAARPSSTATRSDVEGYVRRLREQLTGIRAEHGQLATTAKLGQILRAAAQHHAREAESVQLHSRTQAQAQAVQRAEALQRILSRLPGEIGARERQDLEEAARAVVQAPSEARAERAEIELRRRVQTYTDAARARARAKVEAEELLDAMRGLVDDDLRRHRQHLQAVAEGERTLTPEDRGAIAAEIEDARRRADQAYAGQVMREAFEALGYEVGEEFETAFSSGGEVTIGRADRSPFAVEIGFNPAGGEIETALVRNAEPQGSRVETERQDRAAEEAWCDDFAEVLAAARRRKVVARVVRGESPGAMPVPLSTHATGSARRRRGRSSARAV